jgi:hypothetical protein
MANTQKRHSNKREMSTGTSQRIDNPLKYEVKLADDVFKMFCRFYMSDAERRAFVSAVKAFGEATSTEIWNFTEVRQGIYVASAKANEMNRRGSDSGVVARKALAHVIYLIRYGLIEDDQSKAYAAPAFNDMTVDDFGLEWPEVISMEVC